MALERVAGEPAHRGPKPPSADPGADRSRRSIISGVIRPKQHRRDRRRGRQEAEDQRQAEPRSPGRAAPRSAGRARRTRRSRSPDRIRAPGVPGRSCSPASPVLSSDRPIPSRSSSATRTRIPGPGSGPNGPERPGRSRAWTSGDPPGAGWIGVEGTGPDYRRDPSPDARERRRDQPVAGRLPDLRHHRPDQLRRDEPAQGVLLAEPGDLLDQAAGDVRILAVGHQEDGLDRRVEPLVGHGHAELVFHVRERPEPAEDHPGPDPPDELDGQLLERLDRDVRERRDDQPGQLDPLLDREQRLLVRVDRRSPRPGGRTAAGPGGSRRGGRASAGRTSR